MKAFRAHLYKEYRDHRVGVWGLLALVVVAAVVARVVMASHVFEGLVFLDYFAFGAMSAVALLFAPDLVRSDEARGTLRFLLRMPGGVHLAFWSKAAFLLAALVGFGGLAWLLALAMRGGLDPDVLRSAPFELVSWQAFSYLVACAFWMMAVACWLPRTTLCIAATGLLGGLVLLPSFLLLGGDLALLHYFPSLDPWLAVHPFVALLAAWVSFVRGRREGRGAPASAWRGATVAVVGCLALTGWVGVWIDELSTVDSGEDLRVVQGWLGKGGRYVYLNTQRAGDLAGERPWPSLPVVVDLEDGAWYQSGGPGESFRPLDELEGRGWPRALHAMLVQSDRRTGHVRYVEGQTARVLKEGRRDLAYLDVLEQARAHYRETTPLRLGDGRRCWIFRRKLEAETSDGGYELLPWDERYFAGWVVGRGLFVHTQKGGRWVYDLNRQRIIELDIHPKHFWRIPLAEGVLLGKVVTPRDFDWTLLDPDSGEQKPVSALRDDEWVHGVLDDDRLLVTRKQRASRSSGVPWAVDITTGERRELRVDYPWSEDRTYTMSALRAPLHTRDGRRILSITVDQPDGNYLFQQYYTSHRAGSDELSTPVRAWSFVGCEESGTILVISGDRRELHRVDLDTGEREVLFPMD